MNMEYARSQMVANVPATPPNVFELLDTLDHRPRRSTAMRKHRRRVSRLAFWILQAALALVFLGALMRHIYAFDFKPLAAFCIPILVVYFGFASLLYARGRSLAKGRGQVRSLYAAERAMQATIWHFFGIILGISLYGLLRLVGMAFDFSGPLPAGLWLLLFLAPYLLMQIGLLAFMGAAWAISPAFTRRMSALELGRRFQQ
jgi:hypothetical protein